MEKTLVNKSSIFEIKSKFFLIRLVTYFSFCFILFYVDHFAQTNMIIQTLVLLIYQLFMFGQWYLLGKEIDHRLKIYYRTNSTLERFLYRAITGNLIMTAIFACIGYFGNDILIEKFYWFFFFSVGLFYSWPTRGKIVEESISSQFKEFRYLDSFEKNVLLLITVYVLFSLPELPLFSNVEALKLYLDPREVVSIQIWNFLQVLYFPFVKFPSFYTLSICLHFYVVSIIFFLTSFYSILRYFFSRRLSILGVFAVISTWSFSKIIHLNFFSLYKTSFVPIFIWATFWISMSSTYRTGFFLGFINYFACLINAKNLILYPLHLVIFYFYALTNKTKWFKIQLIKYSFFGLFLCFSVLVFHYDLNLDGKVPLEKFLSELEKYLREKSFFKLSLFGVLLLVLNQFKKFNKLFFRINLNKDRMSEFLIYCIHILIVDLYFNLNLFTGLGLIWILAFFSLIPLEFIFQSITRLRSKRNIIFVIYVLICLLDSHFEQRVRIVIKSLIENDLSSLY